MTIDVKERPVPLYMDTHQITGGVRLDDVADAHRADIGIQRAYDVTYLRYWVDEARGQIFCLVEAPSVEAAVAVHEQAHGLLADAIYQVQEGS